MRINDGIRVKDFLKDFKKKKKFEKFVKPKSPEIAQRRATFFVTLLARLRIVFGH